MRTGSLTCAAFLLILGLSWANWTLSCANSHWAKGRLYQLFVLFLNILQTIPNYISNYPRLSTVRLKFERRNDPKVPKGPNERRDHPLWIPRHLKLPKSYLTNRRNGKKNHVTGTLQSLRLKESPKNRIEAAKKKWTVQTVQTRLPKLRSCLEVGLSDNLWLEELHYFPLDRQLCRIKTTAEKPIKEGFYEGFWVCFFLEGHRTCFFVLFFW